ncbi:catalase family peroxidase [Bradyrhizobium sp. CCGUVB14]|uniref:catalase family peroxidase n=1 Tax=Bradyrhizobium sp. CCGUVB14 TaxID=2949628 RepID=UPI0020B340E6|nr:catalase family peroxidase [Bradyrhizobium sp. CCGUVB14]MCP3446791.1 catalase family peroxidase [Bradyrhizobium sp. CCGUVB14]
MRRSCHLALFLISSFAAATPAVSAEQPTPDQMVDALNGVFGQHHARAVHAKGVILEGSFTPSATASRISKAPHLQQTSVPVVVRFSNFAGVPSIPDNDPLASPHGMAIKFKLPDGSETDLVTHSFNGFPSATVADFRDLLIALGRSGPKAAKPTPLDTYLAGHPRAKAFLTAPKPAPESFATLPYFGVNAFKFTSAAGQTTFGRYQLQPVAGSKYLADDAAAKAQPDYLIAEIRQRMAKEPVKFRLVLQLAGTGDKVNDPSIAWPDSRETTELGTITLTRLVADEAADKSLLFLPNALASGIEAADPMIDARGAAYPVSFGRRQ